MPVAALLLKEERYARSAALEGLSGSLRRRFLEQVRQRRIRPVLDRALPLRDAAEAHRLIAKNEVAGNVVLLPWAS